MYGAEAVILNMSRTLNESSHSSVLGVFSNSANPNLQLHEAAAKEGIESHLIPCNGQIDRTVTASIRELAIRTGADIVHAHGYKADIYVYFALRTSAIPFISTCHNWIDSNLIVSLYGKADRMVLRNYAAVVAVSEEVKQKLLKAGVREDAIHLVRNGIDLRPYDETRLRCCEMERLRTILRSSASSAGCRARRAPTYSFEPQPRFSPNFPPQDS